MSEQRFIGSLIGEEYADPHCDFQQVTRGRLIIERWNFMLDYVEYVTSEKVTISFTAFDALLKERKSTLTQKERVA